MKVLSLFIAAIFVGMTVNAQTKNPAIAQLDSTKKVVRVDAACGGCQFRLPGKGCELAVRIDGKAYFVDGTSIDDHGDAHAKDGFCEAIRKADVQGEVVNNRFKATYFKLVKEKESAAAPKH